MNDAASVNVLKAATELIAEIPASECWIHGYASRLERRPVYAQ